MPDGDVFSRSVDRPWVKAARIAFAKDDDAITINVCLEALANDLNDCGWDGLGDVARLIVRGALKGDDVSVRRQTLDTLNQLGSDWHPERLDAGRRVANRVLVNTEHTTIGSLARENWTLQERQVTVKILVEFLMAKIASACSALHLNRRNGMASPAFAQRERELRELLSRSPSVLDVAADVLQSASGSPRAVRVTRSRIPRLSQGEILSLGIG